MNTHITEIIPDLSECPKWAQEAFDDGQFFNVACQKIKEYEKIISSLSTPTHIVEIK